MYIEHTQGVIIFSLYHDMTNARKILLLLLQWSFHFCWESNSMMTSPIPTSIYCKHNGLHYACMGLCCYQICDQTLRIARTCNKISYLPILSLIVTPIWMHLLIIRHGCVVIHFVHIYTCAWWGSSPDPMPCFYIYIYIHTPMHGGGGVQTQYLVSTLGIWWCCLINLDSWGNWEFPLESVVLCHQDIVCCCNCSNSWVLRGFKICQVYLSLPFRGGGRIFPF